MGRAQFLFRMGKCLLVRDINLQILIILASIVQYNFQAFQLFFQYLKIYSIAKLSKKKKRKTLLLMTQLVDLDIRISTFVKIQRI